MRDYIYLAVLLACTLGAAARPVFGYLAYVFFSTLNPRSMMWGVGLAFPFAEMLAIATMAGIVLQREHRPWILTTEMKLLAIVWMLFGVTTIFGMQASEAFDQFVHVSKILLMVFLSTYVINTEDSFRHLCLVLSLSLGLVGLAAGVFFVTTGGVNMVYGPEQSFLESNNSVGLALAMNVPFLFYLARLEKRRWHRVLMRAMLLGSYPAIIGTFSRGAWIALAFASVVLWLGSRHKIVLATLALLVIVVALPRSSERLQTRYEDLRGYEQEESAQSRLMIWHFAVNAALASPLVGNGFSYYSIEAYQKYLPELLYKYPGKVWSCHSTWFSILSEHGFITFAVWLAMVIVCFRSLKDDRRRMSVGSERPWLGDYASMLRAALMTYLVAGTFLDAAYFDLLYEMVAMTCILKRLVISGEIGADVRDRSLEPIRRRSAPREPGRPPSQASRCAAART